MEHLDAEIARMLVREQLDPAVAARWEAHLAGCDRCRLIMAQERSWLRLLALDEQPAVPQDGADRLLRQLDALAPQRRRGLRWPAALAALFGCGVLAAVLWMQRGVGRGPSEAALARQLGIPTATQRRIIDHRAALDAWRDAPWVADEYEMLKALADQLSAAQPGAVEAAGENAASGNEGRP